MFGVFKATFNNNSEGWVPISRLMFVSVPSCNLNSQSFVVAFPFIQWFKVRGDCSFCCHYHIVNHHCLDVPFIISWRSALLLADNGVPRDNHWPNACDRRTLSHKVVSSTPWHERKLKSPGITPGFMVGPVVLIVLVFCVVLCFLSYLSVSCVLSARCCHYIWIALSWLTFRFSLTFIKAMIDTNWICRQPYCNGLDSSQDFVELNTF